MGTGMMMWRRRALWCLCIAVPLLVMTGCASESTGALERILPSSATPTPTHEALEETPLPMPEPTRPPIPTPPPADPMHPVCVGPTTMSAWAHYDDDLLFLGSQIDEAVRAGQCVRTVFLTGGDAGRGQAYSTGREAGIMRAYNVMRGSEASWTQTPETLATGAQVSLWQPNDDPRLTLVFFHLPDGNLNGEGYPASGEVSLAKLASDKILTLPNLAGTEALSWHQLVDSVAELVTDFQPNVLYTHVPGAAHKWAKGDHADHAITGVLVRSAWQQAGLSESAVQYAVGYQSAGYPANVSGDVLQRKIDVFRAYAADDPVVVGCADDATCLAIPRFGQWLQRQYLRTEPQLWTE